MEIMSNRAFNKSGQIVTSAGLGPSLIVFRKVCRQIIPDRWQIVKAHGKLSERTCAETVCQDLGMICQAKRSRRTCAAHELPGKMTPDLAKKTGAQIPCSYTILQDNYESKL